MKTTHSKLNAILNNNEIDYSLLFKNKNFEKSDSRYFCIIYKIDNLINVINSECIYYITDEVHEIFNSMTTHIIKENSFIDMLDFPHAKEHLKHHIHMCNIMSELCFLCATQNKIGVDELNHVRLNWLEHIFYHDQLLEEFLSPEEM